MRDQMTETAVEVASLGGKAAATGVGITWVAWIASAEGAALLGLVIAVIGLVVQVYFRRKADRREQEMHIAAMARHAVEMELQRAELARVNQGFSMGPRTDTGD